MRPSFQAPIPQQDSPMGLRPRHSSLATFFRPRSCNSLKVWQKCRKLPFSADEREPETHGAGGVGSGAWDDRAFLARTITFSTGTTSFSTETTSFSTGITSFLCHNLQLSSGRSTSCPPSHCSSAARAQYPCGHGLVTARPYNQHPSRGRKGADRLLTRAAHNTPARPKASTYLYTTIVLSNVKGKMKKSEVSG